MRRNPRWTGRGDDPGQLQIEWGDNIATEPVATTSPLPASNPAPCKTAANEAVRPRHRRSVARLPVPKPLPSAIAAGHFGQDKRGRPIRPTAQEVREITEHHAEKLVELLDTLAGAPQNDTGSIQAEFTVGIAAYAEDFGQHAADQLQAYVKRQASLDSSSRRER